MVPFMLGRLAYGAKGCEQVGIIHKQNYHHLQFHLALVHSFIHSQEAIIRYGIVLNTMPHFNDCKTRWNYAWTKQ